MVLPDNNIFYINHNGDKLILQGNEYSFMDVVPLRAFSWQYTSTDRLNGYGGRASNFRRGVKTVSAQVKIRGFNHAEFVQNMNRFVDIADADCVEGVPGKLYVGNQYLKCFLSVSGTIENNNRFTNFAYRNIEILAVEPYWVTEETTVFNIVTPSEEDTTGKRFDLKYPYRYGTGLAVETLINNHYSASPAIITIYGAVSNPTFHINGISYGVNIVVTSTERLVIDQVSNRIYLVGATGTETNVFDLRDKTTNMFNKFPVGESQIVYDGSFKMSITLVQQRSELKWI